MVYVPFCGATTVFARVNTCDALVAGDDRRISLPSDVSDIAWPVPALINEYPPKVTSMRHCWFIPGWLFELAPLSCITLSLAEVR